MEKGTLIYRKKIWDGFSTLYYQTISIDVIYEKEHFFGIYLTNNDYEYERLFITHTKTKSQARRLIKIIYKVYMKGYHDGWS